MPPTLPERRQVFFQCGPNDGQGGYYRFDTQTGELVMRNGQRMHTSTGGLFSENMSAPSHTASPQRSTPDSIF